MVKEQLKTIHVKEPVDFDPAGFFKKIVGGFCDPSSVFPKDKERSTPPFEGRPASQLLEKSKSGPPLNEVGGTAEEEMDKKQPLRKGRSSRRYFRDEITNQEMEIALNAYKTGSTLRIRRGVEVAFVGLLAVFATLYSLHRLGYQMDLNMMEQSQAILSTSKPLFNIVYNDHDVKLGKEKSVLGNGGAPKREDVAGEESASGASDPEDDSSEGSTREQDTEDTRGAGSDNEQEIMAGEAAESERPTNQGESPSEEREAMNSELEGTASTLETESDERTKEASVSTEGGQPRTIEGNDVPENPELEEDPQGETEQVPVDDRTQEQDAGKDAKAEERMDEL